MGLRPYVTTILNSHDLRIQLKDSESPTCNTTAQGQHKIIHNLFYNPDTELLIAKFTHNYYNCEIRFCFRTANLINYISSRLEMIIKISNDKYI